MYYFRSQLFLLPVGLLEDLYHVSTTCIAWKEQVHVSSEVHAVLQCPAIDSSFLPLVVNTLAVPDDLSHIASHGEGDWDPAYVIHLHPAVTLKNLLPYSIRYLLEVQNIAVSIHKCLKTFGIHVGSNVGVLYVFFFVCFFFTIKK